MIAHFVFFRSFTFRLFSSFTLACSAASRSAFCCASRLADSLPHDGLALPLHAALALPQQGLSLLRIAFHKGAFLADFDLSDLLFPPVPGMLRVLRVLRCASICPGLNFSDSGGQSKSVSLCRHRVVSRLPDTCISKLLSRRSTEVCRSAASVLIVTSVCCSFLLQFITLRHRTSKYYGSHNQCSGFFVGQPFDISQITMPCSARSSSVQTPRAASLNPNHDLPLQGSADHQPVCYHRAFFLGLCNGGQCIFSTLAQSSTVGSSRPSISNSSFIGT